MADKNKNELWTMRHSAEHVMMIAMKRIFGDEKIIMAMGPATDDGFYFDFDAPDDFKISEDDFGKIEEEMQKIIQDDLPFIREEISVEEARKLFSNNPYKQEWIDEIEGKGERVTIYRTGEEFIDLCAGPHVESTGKVGAVKLLSVAGAYWRGDEKNKMLTRVYGTAFPTKEELDAHLALIDEVRENDHRTLGKRLDLFAFSDLVGKGLVMYTPKGTIIKNELKRAVLDACREFGAQEVDIPHMAKIDLYKISGHAEKFEDELFRVQSHYKEEFVLKPVNCPHHTQIYASRPRSYRDLPISYVESTQQHRDEKPGAIGGLNRTRSFEIDDGHTFCTVEQIESEVANLVRAIETFYKSLGMWGNHWVSLSFRDPSTPQKYIGDDADWEAAEEMIKRINDEMQLSGKVVEGEAALYGPKIDIMMKDALGNDRQLGTVQIDFAMPKRFGLTYTDSDGAEKTPVMIHRAILGSYGRFIANLIETTGGAFPLWLSPVQVKILPITDRAQEFAMEIEDALKTADIRVEVDDRSETLQSKIRDAQMEKVPYMLIIGDREAEAKKVSVRTRDGSQQNNIELTSFSDAIKNAANSRSLELPSTF